MAIEDPTPPVADDDFPEFAEPPRHRPPVDDKRDEASERPGSDAQELADDVIARLRREREEGKR
jgi:hypothetical protein